MKLYTCVVHNIYQSTYEEMVRQLVPTTTWAEQYQNIVEYLEYVVEDLDAVNEFNEQAPDATKDIGDISLVLECADDMHLVINKFDI